MADTFQSALAQQGTTPAQQQGQKGKAKSNVPGIVQGLSTVNTVANLVGQGITGIPGIGLSVANLAMNGPAMMQGLANMIGAGVAAFGGNNPSVSGSLSSSIADTYGQGGTGGMFGGSGAGDFTSGQMSTTGYGKGLTPDEVSAVYGDVIGGEHSGPSSGGGDYGGGQEARGAAQGGLVAPRGTGGLQDLMRGYI
jgi:hypothetical protein